MPRFTNAYRALTERLDEVNILCKMAAAKERRDPIALRHEINAMCRGAVVLLSSHLEAFIREIGTLALDSLHAKAIARTALANQFYYHISQDLLDEVRDTVDPEKVGEKIFTFLSSDLTYWSKSGPFPQGIAADRFNRGFSNPSFRKIKKYFNRFGYSDYQHDLNSILKASAQTTINAVDHLVDVRNKIAHGDHGVTKTPSEVIGLVNTIREFCRGTDATFAGWWKANFCSIR